MKGKTEMHALVAGRVQGVAYRNFVESIAHELGITGFVSNLPDGSVEVLAQGEYGVLKVFKQHLVQGPTGALVKGFYDEWRELSREFDSFRII